MQIRNAQKDTDDVTVFFALLGSLHVKALSKHFGEMNPCFFKTKNTSQ